MGLRVHSLGELPANAERSYYIYVLDFGWHEPLGNVLKQNFEKMADLASKNDAVVIWGTESVHFENEVFSYHGIDGEPGDEILPAILITTLHPQYFKENDRSYGRSNRELQDKLLLIPIRKVCSSSDDVVSLIIKIFQDIKDKKILSDFEISRQLSKGRFRALADAIILQPNVSGVGLDLKELAKFFRKE